MRTIIVILIFTVLYAHPVIAQDGQACTSVHKGPVAVFIDPTDEDIAAMQKQYGEEDFDTIADDAMYYNGLAIEFLQKLNIPTCSTENEKHRFITKDGKEYSVDQVCSAWCLILWNGTGKPINASTAEISMYESYLKGAK